MAAKKSPVAAKKPAYKRAAIVDETRDKSTGGDYGTRRWRRFSSRSGPRARPWPRWTLHNAQRSSQILLFLLHFFYRGYETRIKGDLYNYELRGQPSLEDSKLTIVNCIIHVMFVKIASWVAGNVVTLFRSDLGSKAAIFPDIRLYLSLILL